MDGVQQTSAQVFQARTRAAGLDLTSVQFAAMMAISDAPGCDQASVAATIAYDRATIGGVIDRLEQKGYVERTVSKRDRRAREVCLSEQGRNVFGEILPVVSTLQDEILSGLTAQERAAFMALARKALGATGPEAI